MNGFINHKLLLPVKTLLKYVSNFSQYRREDMDVNYTLKCIDCHKEYDVQPMYKCPECDGIIDIKYDYAKMEDKELNTCKQFKQALIYHDQSTEHLAGEGNTALVSLDRTAEKYGIRSVLGKCEFLNPSGSFKDRSEEHTS